MDTLAQIRKQLSNLELKLKSKANDLPQAKYAFCIFLTEDEFVFLKNAYIASEFFRDQTCYPWCHVKLLVEACARSLHKEDRHLEEALTKSIGVAKLYKGYWDNFRNLLAKLDLTSVRGEGGTWSVYANVVLHAGIIHKYFESLLPEFCTKLTSFD